ncbi:Gfo/Idh/MocA family oxidoreductase [Halorarum halophilum]|uniref:Gfo/Idh/MocA family oxidoreductase n=1 Tax=Halorarum halophilum TaxID=2743090 RepID=A0A7D5GER4_9EURY|nr:Gfo/Idh/MocA family oxidoreductase [Halobaculum halophilum]QLG27608.1 Gfo/Idh/MocA family oxidoreductase [Halobaculum halophilum]
MVETAVDSETAHAGEADPLRVGVVGGGYIGTTVGGEFVEHEDARVDALVDIDEGVLETAGVELGVDADSRYTDYAAMLDAEALDAVLIGTPHTLHYDQVLAAFEHDLHVLCDKPLTTDLDDARALVERDRERDEVLMVGYQRHLYEAFVEARGVWDEEGREPRWITAEVCQDWVDRFEGTWRQNPDLSGGGYLYDTGSHLLDCVLWSTRLTPESVSASMEFVDDEERVDGRANVTVRFTNGATASFSLSGETPCMREHVRMWDGQGAVALDSQDWEPSEYAEIDEESGEYRPRIEYEDQRTKADAFVDAIRTDEKPVATALDGLRVTAVTEAAYESARGDGSFVAVDPDDVALE